MHDALSYPRMHAPRSNIIGIFDSTSGETVIENQKGQHFRTMGKADFEGKIRLLPEETLYLLERGNLDVRWPSRGEANLDGLPFSLQSAYTYLLGRLGLTLERYTVYAGLKRSGYVVQRGPAWYHGDLDKNVVDPRGPEAPKRESVYAWMYKLLFETKPQPPPPLGPLVGPGLYRSYSERHKLSSRGVSELMNSR